MRTVFRHWRTIRGFKKITARYYRHASPWEVGEHGGRTECDILDDEGKVLSSGVAVCSVDDSFCYKRGRDISFGRAMKNLPGGYLTVVENVGPSPWETAYPAFDTFGLM